MRRLSFYFFIFITNFAFGQNQRSPFSCGTTFNQEVSEIDQRQYEYDMSHNFERYANGDTIIIPIVVHNLLCNQYGFVPDTTILRVIDDVNDALANRNEFFDPDGLDTRFRIQLVDVDPEGNPTSGIQHITDDIGCGGTIDESFSTTTQWNIFEYLNIYIYRIPNLSGLATTQYNEISEDKIGDFYGVICNMDILSHNYGIRVFVHEIGHFLGLLHTFGAPYEETCFNENCLKNNDKVCDTPPNAIEWSDCIGLNSCDTDVNDKDPYNPFNEDQIDLEDNYMDYSPCISRFTQGQVSRMHWIYEHYLHSLSDSLENKIKNCPEISVDFLPTKEFGIAGQPFLIENKTKSDATFRWYINGDFISNSQNIQINQDTIGVSTIRLEATSIYSGCESKWTIEKSIRFRCENDDIKLKKPLYMKTDSCYQLEISGVDRVNWIWNGNNEIGNTIEFCSSESGIIPILIQKQNNNCTQTDTIWISIHDKNENKEISFFKEIMNLNDEDYIITELKQLKNIGLNKHIIVGRSVKINLEDRTKNEYKNFIKIWNPRLDYIITFYLSSLYKKNGFRLYDAIMDDNHEIYFYGAIYQDFCIIGKIDAFGKIAWIKKMRLENIMGINTNTSRNEFISSPNQDQLNLILGANFITISKAGKFISGKQMITLPEALFDRNRFQKIAFSKDRIWFCNIQSVQRTDNYAIGSKFQKDLTVYGIRVGSMKKNFTDLKVKRYESNFLIDKTVRYTRPPALAIHPSGNAIISWERLGIMTDTINKGYTQNIAMFDKTSNIIWNKTYAFTNFKIENSGRKVRIQCQKNGDFWLWRSVLGNNLIKFDVNGEIIKENYFSTGLKRDYASYNDGINNSIILNNGILTSNINQERNLSGKFNVINQFVPFDNHLNVPCNDSLSDILYPVLDQPYFEVEAQDISFKDVNIRLEEMDLILTKSITQNTIICDTIINLEDYSITLTDTTYHCPDSMTLTLNICRYESGTLDSVRLLTFNKSPLDTAATIITNDFIHFNDTETCKTVTITSDIHDYHFALNTKPDYKTPFTLEPSFYDANERLESDYKNNFLDIVHECQMVATHDVVVAPSISVFPNPAKDVLNIEMKNGSMQRVDLYNMMGQLVISKKIGSYSTQIDIQGLSDGVYFLDVYGRDGMAIREKVVVFE